MKTSQKDISTSIINTYVVVVVVVEVVLVVVVVEVVVVVVVEVVVVVVVVVVLEINRFIKIHLISFFCKIYMKGNDN